MIKTLLWSNKPEMISGFYSVSYIVIYNFSILNVSYNVRKNFPFGQNCANWSSGYAPSRLEIFKKIPFGAMLLQFFLETKATILFQKKFRFTPYVIFALIIQRIFLF